MRAWRAKLRAEHTWEEKRRFRCVSLIEVLKTKVFRGINSIYAYAFFPA